MDNPGQVMASVREAFEELRRVLPPAAREERRVELIDLAAQAVEAMYQREGSERLPRSSSLASATQSSHFRSCSTIGGSQSRARCG